jgi:predicted SprT family Zn-dependent metalloprotease
LVLGQHGWIIDHTKQRRSIRGEDSRIHDFFRNDMMRWLDARTILVRLQSDAMPWRCPACQQPIQHNETEATPRSGAVYRCHVCRLELVLDATTERLIVRPIPDSDRNRPPRHSS